MSPVKKEFPLSSPFCLLFMSSSFLVALARITNTILSTSTKNEHSCLIPHLGGKAFSFSPVNMMFSVGFS